METMRETTGIMELFKCNRYLMQNLRASKLELQFMHESVEGMGKSRMESQGQTRGIRGIYRDNGAGRTDQADPSPTRGRSASSSKGRKLQQYVHTVHTEKPEKASQPKKRIPGRTVAVQDTRESFSS